MEQSPHHTQQVYHASPSVHRELADYAQLRFRESSFTPPVHFPLPDEPFVSTWETYVDYAETEGVFPTLKQYLVQLAFPIQEGMSQMEAYLTATRKGMEVEGNELATGLVLEDPEGLDLSVYQCPAGKIPVLRVRHAQDFQSLVQALSCRNEPVKIPASMGAAMIKGINNWDRIRRLKARWKASQPSNSWADQFRKEILPHPALYQDKLILLSQKPYSNVPAAELGLGESDWLRYSTMLRLEHECTHFFTLRYFGGMYNHMHDELIADYMGLTWIVEDFRPDWMLRFLGLENYPQYREGGRLQNYLGDPPLSPAAFSVLQQWVYQAIDHLAAFEARLGPAQDLSDRSCRLLAVCGVGLAELASKQGTEQLLRNYQAARM